MAKCGRCGIKWADIKKYFDFPPKDFKFMRRKYTEKFPGARAARAKEFASNRRKNCPTCSGSTGGLYGLNMTMSAIYVSNEQLAKEGCFKQRKVSCAS